jgi:uncharacterized membrane protein (UPF0127 family)
MSASIDIVFLDSGSVVLEVRDSVAPWGVCFGPRGTRSVLELPAGETRKLGMTAGDSIRNLPAD